MSDKQLQAEIERLQKALRLIRTSASLSEARAIAFKALLFTRQEVAG